MNAQQAAWLTRDQAERVAAKARQKALEVVYASQAQWPHDRCEELLDRCVREWSCGPTVTAHRLAQAQEYIRHAYSMSGLTAGLLLVPDPDTGGDRMPLYMQTEALARRLSVPGALWIDLRGLDRFNGELTDG
ncbi:MAG: hypothetical protein N4A39_11895 [Roseicyclus sp.]|jgi:hypothetical protein|nr:hypothetical protein [Roseicyclus sp.]